MNDKQKIVEEFGNCKLSLGIEVNKGHLDNLTDFNEFVNKVSMHSTTKIQNFLNKRIKKSKKKVSKNER